MKKTNIFSDFKQSWKTDLLSGFLVSLIALPLSLGIAAASGFPPIMGIITAMVGGIAVTFFMGSEATIKGPAAGLIVIMAGSVGAFKEVLNDPDLAWKLTAGLVVIAGIIQIILGSLKVAKMVEFFPLSAVHGMLAAIGLIIIFKQLPIALGDDPSLNKGKDIIGLIMGIPADITHETTQIAIIGIGSVIILFAWNAMKHTFFKKIPAAFVVLVFGIVLGQVFGLGNTEYSKFKPLVHIDSISPKINADFNVFDSKYMMISIKFLIMIVLIGSLESLLSSKAIDLIDPEKRKSNLHKDFRAVGIGNAIAGLFGGLPMISEIVRSSANLGYGGRKRWANLFHGLFLLLYVIALYPFINMVPMSTLAALMIFAGYRLASPKEFVHTFKIGWEQFVIFTSTIIVTLSTDLLIGVFSGIAVKLLIQMILGVPPAHYFKSKIESKKIGENKWELSLNTSGLFTNILAFTNKIKSYPANAELVLDVKNAKFVDHSFMEKINELNKDLIQNGGKLELIGLDQLKNLSNHPHSSRRYISA